MLIEGDGTFALDEEDRLICSQVINPAFDDQRSEWDRLCHGVAKLDEGADVCEAFWMIRGPVST